MANTNRRYLDSNGNQFMPMNVEGGSWNEHFFTTKKLVTLGAIVFTLVFLLLYIADSGTKFVGSVILLGTWGIVSFYATRFIIFEEKFYYKMYKILKEHEVTTPAIFWDIASIRDTSDGAILTYSDTKIGVLVKIERDTITGKHSDFKENHYDAISNFYRELIGLKYKFIQFNIMEKAGKDPRLESLDPLVVKSDNANINRLMELEVGYIKNITHHTLYESDYILIYTNDLARVDNIIGDTIDCIYNLMDGAYIGYKILNSREIIEFVKDIYGVQYFNYTQATLDMFKMRGSSNAKPFTICGVEYSDGRVDIVDQRALLKIYSLTSDVMSGRLKIDDVSIRDTLEKIRGINKINKFETVDFDDIEKGFEPNNPRGTRGTRGTRGGAKQSKEKPVNKRQSPSNNISTNEIGNGPVREPNKPLKPDDYFANYDDSSEEYGDISDDEFIDF